MRTARQLDEVKRPVSLKRRRRPKKLSNLAPVQIKAAEDPPLAIGGFDTGGRTQIEVYTTERIL